ncbi:MAG: hypothetical protein JOZ54_18240 [Acidobacteria bacterium]|nr:hypothetical protein [Acidobacteriota bacterium]
MQGLLPRLVAALEAAEVPYMLTGSYASSLHSIPRATKDLDIVVFPNREQLTRFLTSLSPDEYYTDLEDALECLKWRRQFNVVDYATGWKIDFIIPPFDEFNVEEFSRRQTIDVDGVRLSVITPEDIVLAKLLWAKAGESMRQIEDAATVVRIQADSLNVAYIESWVRRLDLGPQWDLARKQSGRTSD